VRGAAAAAEYRLRIGGLLLRDARARLDSLLEEFYEERDGGETTTTTTASFPARSISPRGRHITPLHSSTGTGRWNGDRRTGTALAARARSSRANTPEEEARRVLRFLASSEQPLCADAEGNAVFAGDSVEIVNLTTKPNLNWLVGIISKAAPGNADNNGAEDQRFAVIIDADGLEIAKWISVRPGNLRRAGRHMGDVDGEWALPRRTCGRRSTGRSETLVRRVARTCVRA